MIKKFLSVCVLVNLLFTYSYSMEQESADDALSEVERNVISLCEGQCYRDLDNLMRQCDTIADKARVLDLAEKYSNENGDICMTYNLCRIDYESIHAGTRPSTTTLNKIHKRFIFFLAKVYIDAAACLVIAETEAAKKQCENIYNLLKSKVQNVWYYQVAEYDSDFKELSKAALGHIETTLAKSPSPIWIYFSQTSCFSGIGIAPYSIWFGNTDTRYTHVYRENARAIGEAKSAAFGKIREKISTIAASEKANKEKWADFFSLNFKDI